MCPTPLEVGAVDAPPLISTAALHCIYRSLQFLRGSPAISNFRRSTLQLPMTTTTGFFMIFGALLFFWRRVALQMPIGISRPMEPAAPLRPGWVAACPARVGISLAVHVLLSCTGTGMFEILSGLILDYLNPADDSNKIRSFGRSLWIRKALIPLPERFGKYRSRRAGFGNYRFITLHAGLGNYRTLYM